MYRWNTSEQKQWKGWNELLEGFVDFVGITGDSWTTNHKHFLLSVVVVHGISSDFKNHLVLPLPLAKLDSLEVVMLWKECC